MKLRPLIKENDQMTTVDPKQQDEANSYDMKFVNGGFSNSVDVGPGVGDDTGKIFVSINIFGGGKKKRIQLPTSEKAKKLLAAYQVAIQKDDPSSEKIKQDLDQYYADIKNTVAQNFIPLLKELDLKTRQILINSVKEVNSK